MELVSVERVKSPMNGWVLTLRVSDQLLGSSSEQSPAIQVSSSAVRIDAFDGGTASYSVPADMGAIDSDRAVCRISRRRSELRISWPVSECVERNPPVAVAACTGVADVYRTGVLAHGSGVESDELLDGAAVARDALDYSRFANIGAEEREEVELAAPLVCSPPKDKDQSAPSFKAGAVVRSVPVAKGAKTAIDYSRFEDIDEEDATLTPAEVDSLWRKHCKSRRMRGEQPMPFEAWRRARARCVGAHEPVDPPGRGLWCRTNLEEEFEKEAGVADNPPDDQLPALAPPEHVSALKDAPGARIEDVTSWAHGRLKEELLKACSSDRSSGLVGVDVRIDAIAHSVELEGGNAAVVIEGGQFICGYRFTAAVSYCVNVSERPAPGTAPKETQFFGDIRLPELKSGAQTFEEIAKTMRTSLRDPKPPKQHLDGMKPVIARFELSLAYFIRRFERRLLAKVVGSS